ncbi:MAG: hypothetical protein ACTSRP_14745 [Candidatus Helarchaeota archaeon]
MKEIVHKGLTRLVGTYGSSPIESNALEIIINASVEPDQVDRKKFSENLFYGINWLFNHTIGAKKLAIKNLINACNAYAINDISWLKSLGITFHFITDWGTPHHALNSKSNPFLDLTRTGAQLGGKISTISKSSTSWKDELKKYFQGALIGGGISGAIGLFVLYLSHSNFESRCDELWEENIQLIRENFRGRVKHQHVPEQLNLALDLFEEKMNYLRQLSKNLPSNWINTCNSIEYADYMTEIALVMNLACEIVMMNK